MEAGNRSGPDVGAAEAGWTAAFDRLFERGRTAVLAGTHHRDSPPVPGGRWGLSVVFRPDTGYADRLTTVTAEAMSVAGSGHWPTGAPQAVHFTVRAIEAYRPDLSVDHPLVVRCAAALHRAAQMSRPVRLQLRGLTLTPSGIMACGYPVDTAAYDFAARLGVELGADAWFEAAFDRNVWYATLVHFTGPIPDPSALVRWVAARRRRSLGVVDLAAAELVRFRFNGRQPVRAALAACRLGTPEVQPATAPGLDAPPSGDRVDHA